MTRRQSPTQTKAATRRMDTGRKRANTALRFKEAMAETMSSSMARPQMRRTPSPSMRSAIPRALMVSRTIRPPRRVKMNSGNWATNATRDEARV